MGYSLNQRGLSVGVIRDPRDRTVKLSEGSVVCFTFDSGSERDDDRHSPEREVRAGDLPNSRQASNQVRACDADCVFRCALAGTSWTCSWLRTSPNISINQFNSKYKSLRHSMLSLFNNLKNGCKCHLMCFKVDHYSYSNAGDEFYWRCTENPLFVSLDFVITLRILPKECLFPITTS
jgi:hypothetical protein